MSTFEVKVYKLKIEEHPNADSLELAVVGDYRSIVRKGQFKTGDLGVYIPEASILPDWLIERMGLVGKLAGNNHDRVKAVRLRQILSQGLIYPVEYDETLQRHYVLGKHHGGFTFIEEQDDLTSFLGIEKYEPRIPVHMAGEVFNAFGMTLKYDIENCKLYPNVLLEHEDVVMTEKLHGTWCCFGCYPDAPHPIVTSKGLSSQGLAFKFNAANEDNLYVKAFNQTLDKNGLSILDRAEFHWGKDTPVYILGEIYGRGIQDLHYGTLTPQFRVFDIYVGNPGSGVYIDADQLQLFCMALNVEMVPILYSGPFSKEKMLELTTGKEVVSGKESNIREGVVIKPLRERRDNTIGRVILKSVSEQYLLRKGNTTEFN